MKTTSLKAYENSSNFKKKHYDRIIGVLRQINKPLTYKEIMQYAGFTEGVQVSRRMPELVDKGLVKLNERRKCSIANSLCTTYSI